ncbi:MAG: hypothetical protein QOI31_1041 [Solirubrobacterales bacterium]|jgi:hypothetical protein|nr:hypothetical protein [Solirubrobacterales bacterium]
MKFGKALLVVAAVFAIAVVPMSATGHGKYPTEVTIKGPNGDFSGKVKSDADPCKVDRKVTVFKKRSGDDKKIGSDTSEPNGAWSTGNSGENNGKFYAKAKAEGDVCEAGKSETIEL